MMAERSLAWQFAGKKTQRTADKTSIINDRKTTGLLFETLFGTEKTPINPITISKSFIPGHFYLVPGHWSLLIILPP